MVRSNIKKKALVVLLISLICIPLISPRDASAITLLGVADHTPKVYGCGVATALNGKIYIFGGRDDSNWPFADILEFDPSTNNISNAGSLTATSRYTNAATASNGIIYVFCSENNSTHGRIEIYDPDTNTVQNLGEYSQIGYRPTVALANGMIYLFGCNYTTPKNIYRFNPTTNSISKVSELPVDVFFSSAATGTDGFIYIFGGQKKSDGNYVDDIYKFDPNTNTVANIADMPYTLCKSYAILSQENNKMYLIGGDSNDNPVSENRILEYDPITNSTVEYASGYSLISASATVSGENIYVVGGNTVESIPFVFKFYFGLLPPELWVALNDNDAVLTWSKVTNATSYIVEKSTDGINFIDLTETSVRNYTDPNLELGTYYYRVRASNTSETSDPSNVVTVTITLGSPFLYVELENNENALLSWSLVTGASSYIVEKSTDGINFIDLTETSVRNYTDPSLEPGTYYYRVRASNTSGTSDPSNVVSVTIQPIPPGLMVFWPSGGQYVEVDWNRGNIIILEGRAQLWREDTVSGIWLPVKDIPESEKDCFTWLDKNVMSGLNYKYQVRVYDTTSWEWMVKVESDWAVLDRPFQAPGGLRVTSKSDTSATITWTPISGAASYKVKISTDEGISWQNSTVGGPPVTVPRPCMAQVKAGTHERSQWSGILRVQ